LVFLGFSEELVSCVLTHAPEETFEEIMHQLANRLILFAKGNQLTLLLEKSFLVCCRHFNIFSAFFSCGHGGCLLEAGRRRKVVLRYEGLGYLRQGCTVSGYHRFEGRPRVFVQRGEYWVLCIGVVLDYSFAFKITGWRGDLDW
jgi:hypothetical protein